MNPPTSLYQSWSDGAEELWASQPSSHPPRLENITLGFRRAVDERVRDQQVGAAGVSLARREWAVQPF